MRIGIYGGTFDPPHNGHIAAAKAAMERLALDKLLLIPTFIPPHKALPAGAASPAQRHDMAVLATAELGKKAEVLDVELERGGHSYTWETLHLLRERYPEDELWLLMGSDMFLTLQDWREPRQVMALARIGAFSRLESGEEAAFARQKAFLEREYGADVTIIPNPQVVELSSTEVRQTLAQGGGAELLPAAVYGYILRERLYSTHRELTGLTPDELRPIALSYLKPKRMPHVLGTEQEAVRLTRRYGGDETQARIAALLHDCTKKLELPEQLALCKQYGIPYDHIIRHYDVMGKKCPAYWVGNDGLEKFRKQVEEVGEVVEKSYMIVDGKKVPVQRILKNGTNYVKIRDVAKALDLEVGFQGNIATLKRK